MRAEAKYHLDVATATLLQHELHATDFALDPHCVGGGPYTVSSIYLDDPEYRGYADKLAGATRRTKYRLRFYAERLGDEAVQLEHKEKDSQLSWKRTHSFGADDVRRFVRTWSGPVLDHLDPRAGCASAVIFVQYRRLAFEHRVHGVRINFDTHLRWSGIDPQREDLVSQAHFEPLREDQVIAEIKVEREYPREVADLVHRWNLHWRATSKYALCIEQMQRCLLDAF